MAGIVFLRTNKFEVKLEGITFKAKDFETISTIDFLFRFNQQPVVGVDVMRHPRDPMTILVLLCFGIGCMILKFNVREPLPEPIFKFLTDERIRFVGFGIPEKKDLFPFESLGLTKNKVDVGYLSSKILDDPKYKNFALADLAKKVLGVNKMVGLTASSSFERHEQIKCAICQLFLSTIIAMTLLRADYKKKVAKFKDASKKRFVNTAKLMACLKGMDTLSSLNEERFKFFNEKKNQKVIAPKGNDVGVKKPAFWDIFHDSKGENENEKVIEDWNDNNPLFGDRRLHETPKFMEVDEYQNGIRTKEDFSQHEQVEELISCDYPHKNDIFDALHHDKIRNPMELKEKQEEVGMKEDVDQYAQVEKCNFCESYRCENDLFGDESFHGKSKNNENVAQAEDPSSSDEYVQVKNKEDLSKKPLKGILKCPSMKSSSPPTPKPDNDHGSAKLRRANSKGCNVSFRH